MTKLSTEEVVNKVAAKPSFKFLALVVGFLSFQLMKAMVAYFPNFGGYIPYKEWRCERGSVLCYERVSEFQVLDSQTWPINEVVKLDNRCMVTITDFTNNTATLFFHDNSGTNTGFLKIGLESEDLTITISSSGCNTSKPCKGTLSNPLDNPSEPLNCTLQFSGTITPEDGAVLTCNGQEFEMYSDNDDDEEEEEEELEGEEENPLRGVLRNVKQLTADGIGNYYLTCPDKKQYNKENLCGSGNDTNKELVVNTDFNWHTDGRSSFAIDWNLQCGGEFLRSLLGSIFFAGAMVGTFFGGNLFDRIGRKYGALVGYTLVTLSTLASAFSPSIEFMFVCRAFQGAGFFIGSTGGFILLLEYTASKYRIQANIAVQFCDAIGSLINTFLAYFIKDWHWLGTSYVILFVVFAVPLFLIPESPRHCLVNKRKVKEAKKNLKWLAKINGSEFDVDSVDLNDVELTNEENAEPTFLETMRDFMKYREVPIQLLILMWMWLVAGFLYYGFNFSWSELGEDLYISYFFAAIGECLAYLGMGFPTRYFGRKASMMAFYLIASGTFVMAQIPYKLSPSFSVEMLSCLLGAMFVSAAFCGDYLYTMELAPTSHRGKMLGYCSFAARIGSFCGPQAALLFSWSKPGTLILFTVMAATAGGFCFRLPDTKDVPTPSTAQQVQQRKNGVKQYSPTYQEIKNETEEDDEHDTQPTTKS